MNPDDPVVSDEECWNIARRVGWSDLEIEHSLVVPAIRASVKRGLEMAARRAQQSACLCALLQHTGEMTSRRGKGETFGIEAKNHISDCPGAVLADLIALAARLDKEAK